MPVDRRIERQLRKLEKRAAQTSRKQPLSVERIVQTALDIVAAEGFEALTMRRLTSTMQEKAALGEEFRAEDREFHLLLMQTTGNALAVQLTGAFWDVHAIASGSLSPATDLSATADAHVAILDAIEKGVVELLRDAGVLHTGPGHRVGRVLEGDLHRLLALVGLLAGEHLVEHDAQ